MKQKKFLSFLLALTLAVSLFAGMSVTANAAGNTYTVTLFRYSGYTLNLIDNSSKAESGDTIRITHSPNEDEEDSPDDGQNTNVQIIGLPSTATVSNMTYNSTTGYWAVSLAQNESCSFTLPEGFSYYNSKMNSGVYTVEVAAYPTGVSLSQTTAELTVGESFVLYSTLTPDYTTKRSVSWSTSNDAVLSVTDAINETTITSGTTVTALSPGTATVTVKTASNDTATCTITVKAATKSITINESITGGTVTSDKTTAASGDTVTLTVTADTGYELDSLSVTDASGNAITTKLVKGVGLKYEFTMPASAATVSATFKQSGYSVTVDSTITGGTVTTDKTTAEEDATVTLTVTPNAGYQLDTLTVTNKDGPALRGVTAGENNTYTFTMPGNAVDVSATFTEQATTGDVTLDLEDGDGDSDLTDADDYADHMDITQYYIKTTNTETTTNNRVQVSWASDSNLTFKVNDGKKWDPSTLAWVTDSSTDGKATLTDGNVTTFTFKNFSTKAFTIVPTFEVNSELSSDLQASYTGVTYDQASYTVNAIEVGDDGVAAAKYFSDADKTTVNESALPTANVVATLRVDQTKFDNAAATSSAVKYGTFTFTLTAVDAG